MQLTDPRPDAVTVTCGQRSVTLMRPEVSLGLAWVCNPQTCDETTVIRGLRFTRSELEACKRAMDDKRRAGVA